jgi:hypothetical protein
MERAKSSLHNKKVLQLRLQQEDIFVGVPQPVRHEGVPYRLSPLRYSRKWAPTWGCSRANSTVASRKPSLLPQS